MFVKHATAKTGKELENRVNYILEKLKSDSCKVVDIKYSSSDMDFSALIVYQRRYGDN